MFSRFGLSSVLRPAARALSTSVAQAPRIKHKIPRKRASSLLSILQNEEYTRLKNGRQWEKILPGDSVEIEKVPFTTSSEVEVVKGVVIGLTNKLGDSRIRILNCEFGTPVERNLCMYSPLIKNVKVLQRAFIHKGKKRVRRSKLYYLKNLHPDLYTVK